RLECLYSPACVRKRSRFGAAFWAAAGTVTTRSARRTRERRRFRMVSTGLRRGSDERGGSAVDRAADEVRVSRPFDSCSIFRTVQVSLPSIAAPTFLRARLG